MSSIGAVECRDEAALQRFVEDEISPNAWPIHSRPLRRLIERQGLDLAPTRQFALTPERLAALMRRLHDSSRRVERKLGIRNGFHNTLHNFEVLLRLLLLEWPGRTPWPAELRDADRRVYPSFAAIEPVLHDLISRLSESGFPPWKLARDVLAAAGHDYGHTGATERLDASNGVAALTHEETAERHVAKFAIEYDFPPALALAGLAGIRATTFRTRRGRKRVQAANDFERRLTLADVAGFVLPADQWLTHVAIPLLEEKLIRWRCRQQDIPKEIDELRRQLASLPADDPSRQNREERIAELETERRDIVNDLPEFFRSELGFLEFIRGDRLAAVPRGKELWGPRIAHRIDLIRRVLAREELLEGLGRGGFALLGDAACKLSNAESLATSLGNADPHLREAFGEFVRVPRGTASRVAESV